VVRGWQVVERHAARIPARRVGVARRVEGDRVAQSGEVAVVHQRDALAHVAQRRHLERAAQRLVAARRRALRPAQPEVEERRVGVGRDARVARHAQVVVGEVGEQRVGGVARRRVRDVAGGAVALLRVEEEVEPLALQRGELRATGGDVIVLRRKRCEALGPLERGDRRGDRLQRRVGIVEHARAPLVAEEAGVARGGDLRRQRGDRWVVHLVGREERLRGLRLQRGGAPVEELSADGDGSLVRILHAERRREARVHRRRRVAQSE